MILVLIPFDVVFILISWVFSCYYYYRCDYTGNVTEKIGFFDFLVWILFQRSWGVGLVGLCLVVAGVVILLIAHARRAINMIRFSGI